MRLSPDTFRRLCDARRLLADASDDALSVAAVARRAGLSRFHFVRLAAEHNRLTAKGVMFTRPPADAGPVIVAVCSDTCGNLIQLYQRR